MAMISRKYSLNQQGSIHNPRAPSYDSIDIPILKLHSNLAQQNQEQIKLSNVYHRIDNHLNTKSMEIGRLYLHRQNHSIHWLEVIF